MENLEMENQALKAELQNNGEANQILDELVKQGVIMQDADGNI